MKRHELRKRINRVFNYLYSSEIHQIDGKSLTANNFFFFGVFQDVTTCFAASCTASCAAGGTDLEAGVLEDEVREGHAGENALGLCSSGLKDSIGERSDKSNCRHLKSVTILPESEKIC